MPDRNAPNVQIEKISLERLRDAYEALHESSKEWFAQGMLSKPEFSMQEFEAATKNLMKEWANDESYYFNIVDASTDQLLGFIFLNHVNRTHQIANLGYMVRTSRTGGGIATAAVKLVAGYGFEKLGFHRIEIVVRPENIASLKVAEKAGAMREGLLRNRVLRHGSPCDAYMHSLIPEDFGMDKIA